MPRVNPRDGVRRHNYQESAFCNDIVPYYFQMNPKDKKERAQFFRAAHILLFDRFPIETAGLSTAAAQGVRKKAKRSFTMRVTVSALFLERSLIYIPSEHWTEGLTLRADRERRRKEWMTIGGVPRHHQYMIAWAPL